MATKKCKYCQAEIDAKARVCPQCRKKLGTSATTGCLVVIFAGIVAMMFVCISVMKETTSGLEEIREAEQRRLSERTPEQVASEEKQKAMEEGITQAQIQCPRAIKATLKAPSTAKIPHISKYNKSSGSFVAIAAEDADVIRVMTYVDSQNSFGAIVRTNFQCDLKKIDGQWVIIRLETFP